MPRKTASFRAPRRILAAAVAAIAGAAGRGAWAADAAESRYCPLWPPALSDLCLTSGEWASWAQVAVAAIGVAVAILVVQHQLAADRKKTARAEAGRLRMRAHLLKLVADAGQELHQQLEAGALDLERLEYDIRLARQAGAALLRIPMETIPNEAELLVLIAAERDVRAVLDALQAADQGPFSSGAVLGVRHASADLRIAVVRLVAEAARVIR